jgi:hypothetical protein
MADKIKVTDRLGGFEYTWNDIEDLGVAMHTQGEWFLGKPVRTAESAWDVARDLLVALHLMGFKLTKSNLLEPTQSEGGPPPVVHVQRDGGKLRSSNVGVPGQAGNSR